MAAAAQGQVVASPNDPDFAYQWSLQTIGLLSHSGAAPAWSVTEGSPDIVVAVLDSGIDISHPDLQANIWNNTGARVVWYSAVQCSAVQCSTMQYNAVQYNIVQ